MVATTSRSELHPLRHWLKEGTAALHDRLDASVDSAALGDEARYCDFLIAQYRARGAVEEWARAHLDPDIRPPETADLIAQDLRELGKPVPAHAAFDPPPSDPLGVAWAIGGSSLGNKMLLSERRRMSACHAERFLSDTRGIAYFRSLLPKFAAPVSRSDADGAVRAAEAVFQTFLASVQVSLRTAA